MATENDTELAAGRSGCVVYAYADPPAFPFLVKCTDTGFAAGTATGTGKSPGICTQPKPIPVAVYPSANCVPITKTVSHMFSQLSHTHTHIFQHLSFFFLCIK